MVQRRHHRLNVNHAFVVVAAGCSYIIKYAHTSMHHLHSHPHRASYLFRVGKRSIDATEVFVLFAKAKEFRMNLYSCAPIQKPIQRTLSAYAICVSCRQIVDSLIQNTVNKQHKFRCKECRSMRKDIQKQSEGIRLFVYRWRVSVAGKEGKRER